MNGWRLRGSCDRCGDRQELIVKRRRRHDLALRFELVEDLLPDLFLVVYGSSMRERLRDPRQTDPELVAETQFALAHALAEADSDQARASSLATKALETYRRGTNEKRAAAVQAWLDSRAHRRSRRTAPGHRAVR